jgi:hypothetical protein
VPKNLHTTLKSWLQSEYDAVSTRTAKLEAAMKANKSRCSRVLKSDAVLASQCQNERSVLATDWNSYEADRLAYERKRQWAILRQQQQSALEGIEATAKTFLSRAKELALTSAADQMVAVVPATAALIAKPAQTIAVGGGALIGLLLAFEAKYPDCTFGDQELRMACQNLKIFAANLKRAGDQIEQSGLASPAWAPK